MPSWRIARVAGVGGGDKSTVGTIRLWGQVDGGDKPMMGINRLWGTSRRWGQRDGGDKLTVRTVDCGDKPTLRTTRRWGHRIEPVQSGSLRM